MLYPVKAVVMLFVLAPLLVIVAMSVSDTAFATFPPKGFTLGWYVRVLHDRDFLAAVGFSALLAIAATRGALLLGTPAAFALVRCRVPARELARALLLSPLVFPRLVTR